jgi:hypothetical protein
MKASNSWRQSKKQHKQLSPCSTGHRWNPKVVGISIGISKPFNFKNEVKNSILVTYTFQCPGSTL